MELLLQPLDTLFFKGSRPFDAGETLYAECLFPPAPSTLQGMVRTAILERFCVSVSQYSAGKCGSCPKQGSCEVPEVVGAPGSSVPGTLDLRGPYLVRQDGQAPAGVVRYFAAPADLLVARGASGELSTCTTAPDGLVECDLGRLRLPPAVPGSAPALWITEGGLMAYLAGEEVSLDDVLWQPGELGQVLIEENKVGIGQDKDTKATVEGLLYSLSMMRLADGYGLGVTVAGVPAEMAPALNGSLLRLGGEGRMVTCEIRETTPAVGKQSDKCLKSIAEKKRLRVVLLQPGKFGGSWLPTCTTSLSRGEPGAVEWLWEPALPGRNIKLRIVSARIEKPRWLGGWDLANNCSRSLQACVPAGSVYYCEIEDGDTEDLAALHMAKIGEDAQSGYGQVALGVWI
ncbi:MAG: type III-B CRISPR module-associated protein Cmr3 [Armatimonadetes bacterium]|nr:type III-B CRISPR module-associated protein Cmr3 [Armatimonadota bacterium]